MNNWWRIVKAPSSDGGGAWLMRKPQATHKNVIDIYGVGYYVTELYCEPRNRIKDVRSSPEEKICVKRDSRLELCVSICKFSSPKWGHQLQSI